MIVDLVDSLAVGILRTSSGALIFGLHTPPAFSSALWGIRSIFFGTFGHSQRFLRHFGALTAFSSIFLGYGVSFFS